jgi:hypothetical protein
MTGGAAFITVFALPAMPTAGDDHRRPTPSPGCGGDGSHMCVGLCPASRTLDGHQECLQPSEWSAPSEDLITAPPRENRRNLLILASPPRLDVHQARSVHTLRGPLGGQLGDSR